MALYIYKLFTNRAVYMVTNTFKVQRNHYSMQKLKWTSQVQCGQRKRKVAIL